MELSDIVRSRIIELEERVMALKAREMGALTTHVEYGVDKRDEIEHIQKEIASAKGEVAGIRRAVNNIAIHTLLC